jgi:hypothetical protein
VDVITDRIKNGTYSGKTTVRGRIIKHSDVNVGQDLAIIWVEDNSSLTNLTTKFQLGKYIPAVGQGIYHIGSYGGEFGHGSFSRGEISYVGRLMSDIIFDQDSTTVFKGSSGGGIFLENGNCIGMVVRTKGGGCNYSVPIRRMEAWANKEGVLWALDPNVPMPSEFEFRTLDIFDKPADKK